MQCVREEYVYVIGSSLPLEVCVIVPPDPHFGFDDVYIAVNGSRFENGV